MALVNRMAGLRANSLRTFCVYRRGRELDNLGVWNSGLQEIKEESSLRHGTLIPKVPIDQIGVSIHRGRRMYQEDRYVVSDNVGVVTDLDLRLLAVFDGHGGDECSQFCAENLEVFVTKQIGIQLEKGPQLDIRAALTGAITEINDSFRSFLDDKKCGANSSGTTATIALIRDGYELVVAQIGDSRALLLRGDQYLCLTEDHCASNPEERKRIESCGGQVIYDEVGRHLVNKKLAMSRSIGDFELKPYGVICDPTFIRRNFKHYKDSCLVMVTDGVTYVMSNEEISKTVNLCEDPGEAAEKLVEQALLHACQDNLTAIILPLGSWGKFTTDSGPAPIMSLGRNMALSSRFG